MYETARDSEVETNRDAGPVPGAVVVWSDRTPRLIALRIPPAGLVLGRETLAEAHDDRMSRQHARLAWAGDHVRVADLGSRNGTYVNGRQIASIELAAPAPTVIRIGRTVLIAVADVRAFEGPSAKVTLDDGVVGPTLRATWSAVERAARGGRSLLVTGESGSGKELAARVFHRASGVAGEVVAVNCAAIPAGLAERLLFGTRKGAYSGADRDAEGYLAAADGGTLFLDEVAELDLEVQAKLLRVLETGELLALGAARPRPVQLRVVAATLRDLRGAVAAGRFRDDLFYRIGRPEVRVPPLRERLEEIPWLCAQAVAPRGLPAHPALIEACLLRPWPGNVRELNAEVARAAHEAIEANQPAVRVEDLDEQAGRPTAAAAAPAVEAEPKLRSVGLPDDDDAIAAALRAEGGNISRAARRLGVHRTQLRRYLAKHPEAAALAEPGEPSTE
ncbi:MAG: sigma 54-interacting transcriptional regulator [Kofleriaceae bacterium]|nr:sigma 54-interacting transcriptional regulator [Kofleriaceae bacterium]MBP9170074.1 sigma 54-interacting transcriptional regulator [Kofleriaceae bacterium]MBP9858225.1 sigma 54-interacting transcriptional regulator [Kofleriaceae bacterium]